MVQRDRDELEVLGLPQELRREVVANVVEPEALDARALADCLLFRLCAGIGQWGALAPMLAPFGPLTDESEDRSRMMVFQRLKDRRDGVSDRRTDRPTALADRDDGLSRPIDIFPTN
jgi:hypothetical protein